jgi:hypothetical protein
MTVRETIFGMSSAAQEVFEKLFLFGPTEDGDIPSKQGRGELCQLGYCHAEFGWNWLTREGIAFALDPMMLDRAKDKWLKERSEAIHQMRHPNG